MTADSPEHRRVQPLAAALRDGDRRAIARAMNLLDDKRPAQQQLARALMAQLPRPELCVGCHVVGFTGPPGAGKSSLISALIKSWRAACQRVTVLAVDPSSALSGGALLGDRLRMQVDAADDGVFIRSLSSRNSFGGLAPELLPMAVALMNACDVLVIETVGVGQREIDIAMLADTTCLVVQPGAGDSIQFIKAGIMEVPDVLVVNKSDLGVLATRASSELRATLPADSERELFVTSAAHGDGVDELAEALAHRHDSLAGNGDLKSLRADAVANWTMQTLRAEFGAHGIKALGGEASLREALTARDDDLLSRLAYFSNWLADQFVSTADCGPGNSSPKPSHSGALKGPGT